MNVLDKLGMLYSLQDCGNRSCGNCVSRDFCRGFGERERLNLIKEISAEVRTIIKERDEAIAKLQEVSNDKEK